MDSMDSMDGIGAWEHGALTAWIGPTRSDSMDGMGAWEHGALTAWIGPTRSDSMDGMGALKHGALTAWIGPDPIGQHGVHAMDSMDRLCGSLLILRGRNF